MAENAPEEPHESADGPASDALYEVFDLVSSETRIEMLEALWEASKSDETLQFSTLRERTGVRDSGKFNYHLDKLTPRLVRKTADGYELTFAGKQLMGAAVSGVYTAVETTTVDPISVGDCFVPDCDGELAARYDAGKIVVDGVDCDHVITEGMPAPPVIASAHDDADLPAVFDRFLLDSIETMNNGFCLLCGGPLDRSLYRFHDASGADEKHDSGYLRAQDVCRVCGNETGNAIAAALLTEPPVVAFLVEHDVDLRDRYLWELDWLVEMDAEVTSEDPVRVDATIQIDDDRLDLTLDGDVDVIDYTRM